MYKSKVAKRKKGSKSPSKVLWLSVDAEKRDHENTTQNFHSFKFLNNVQSERAKTSRNGEFIKHKLLNVDGSRDKEEIMRGRCFLPFCVSLEGFV